uniref:Uncharacterized protein n=1 Tax=Anopheles atroparvus TaxID=41427 RepID=A0AAG5DAG2_ANOAO
MSPSPPPPSPRHGTAWRESVPERDERVSELGGSCVARDRRDRPVLSIPPSRSVVYWIEGMFRGRVLCETKPSSSSSSSLASLVRSGTAAADPRSGVPWIVTENRKKEATTLVFAVCVFFVFFVCLFVCWMRRTT